MTTLSQSMDARGQRRAANSIKVTRGRGAKTAKTAEERDRDSDRKLRRRRNIANTRRMTFCGERPCHTRNLSQPHLIPSSEGKISTQVGYPLNSNVTLIFHLTLCWPLDPVRKVPLTLLWWTFPPSFSPQPSVTLVTSTIINILLILTTKNISRNLNRSITIRKVRKTVRAFSSQLWARSGKTWSAKSHEGILPVDHRPIKKVWRKINNPFM